MIPKKLFRKFNILTPIIHLILSTLKKNLPLLNGAENIYFCGSYFGYGFHEDAVRSAAQAAALLGGDRLDDSV